MLHHRRSSYAPFAFGFALLTIATPALADETSSATTTAPSTDAAPASAATPSTKAATAEPTVHLHVKSPSIVAIEREDNGELVCTSPCDRAVPATVRYRIGGSRPSQPFALDGRNGTAKLEVEPATKRGFWGGVAVLGVGGALIVSGAITIALGYTSKADVPGADGTVSDTTYTDTMIAGTVLVVAGVTAALFGGTSVVENRSTIVHGNIVKEPPAHGDALPRRTAVFDSPSSSGAAVSTALPAQLIYVPVLRGAF